MGKNNRTTVVQHGMSRRDFLGASALAAAGFGLSALSGCTTETQAEEGIEWADEADVVVMGFGGAGACAALEALNQGASVAVFEKAPEQYAGGNSTVCEGAGYIPCEETETAFELMRRLSSSQVTDEEIYGYIEAAQNIPSWTSDVAGLELDILDPPDWARTWGTIDVSHVYTRKFSAPTFQTFIAAKVAKHADAKVEYETPVVGLIYDQDTKELHGVRVRDADGAERNVKARRGVIMACGGFEYNNEMLEAHVIDPLPELYPMGTPYNTGDGIVLAQEVGARIRHMANVEFGAYCPRHASAECGTGVAMRNDMDSLNNLVAVNKLGKRFMNESARTQLSPIHPHPAHEKGPLPELEYSSLDFEYPNLPYWFVFDETRRAAGAIASWSNEECPGSWSGKHDAYVWSDDNLTEVDKGWILKADTIEDLAGKIGVDATALSETIKAYNQACDGQGSDEFDRTDSLTPVATPPFYALEMTLSFINTQGGPARNGKNQVLNYNGDPIPRLYAVGEFGSIYSHLYHGGQNVPEAMCAYVAGRDAASLDAWE